MLKNFHSFIFFTLRDDQIDNNFFGYEMDSQKDSNLASDGSLEVSSNGSGFIPSNLTFLEQLEKLEAEGYNSDDDPDYVPPPNWEDDDSDDYDDSDDDAVDDLF